MSQVMLNFHLSKAGEKEKGKKQHKLSNLDVISLLPLASENTTEHWQPADDSHLALRGKQNR